MVCYLSSKSPKSGLISRVLRCVRQSPVDVYMMLGHKLINDSDDSDDSDDSNDFDDFDDSMKYSVPKCLTNVPCSS